MRISGLDSAGIGTLFSSLSSKSTGVGTFGNTTSMLGDYYSIQSGSYRKLLKSYYQMDNVSASDGDKVTKDDTKVKNETKQLKEVKQDATDLTSAADTLLERGSKSVFKKTQAGEKESGTSYEYNTDAIYKAVKEFADSYNDMITSGQKSKVNSIVNNTSSMMSLTATNANQLKQLGITIDADHKLSVDKDAFTKGDMTVAKSLFNTQGGYGYQISVKASMVTNAAELRLSDGSYNKNGVPSMSNLMSSYESYI